MAGRNIHGLGPSKKDEDDEERRGHEQFATGGGQAVMRPTDDLIRRAREKQQGAPAGADAALAAERNVATITVYSNGFQINDEPFRDTDVPANKRFLEELMSGNVPEALEPEVRKKFGPQIRDVAVSLVDKTRERYEPPPPKFDFATSVGRSLGGAAPPPAAGFAGARPKPVVVDPAAPTVTVQLVFHDRKRVKQQFNQTHTVLDVYQHVMAVSGHPGPFNLYAGFPPKPLSNPAATVAQAQLNGASVEQRL